MLPNLNPGQWYEIPNSKISAVLPSPLPPGSATAVINAWSGGCYDTQRGEYDIWGGGHADYAGNEFYSLNPDSPPWRRVWGPTPNAQIVDGETYLDGNPSSRHTYSGTVYSAAMDRVVNVGGSKWRMGNGSYATWTFNPGSPGWTRLHDNPRADIGLFACYNPNNGRILMHKYSEFYEHNSLTDTWTKIGIYEAGITPAGCSVFDSQRQRFYLIGGNVLAYYDLLGPKVGGKYFPLQIVSSSGPQNVVTAYYPGADYHIPSGKIVGWAAGSTVYALDTGAHVWTQIPAAAGSPTPTAPSSTGT